MRKKKFLILAGITNLFFIAKSQTNPGYSGDISQCPYHQAIKNNSTTIAPLLIDDFESTEAALKKWSSPMESGTLKSSIDLSDTAHSGKKGAVIKFAGTISQGSWTNLQCRTEIPADRNIIFFWAKAEKEYAVKITLYQGLDHKGMEIFGKSITLTTAWKRYEVSIDEFTEVIFSHPQKDGKQASKKIYKEKVFALGFAEVDAAVTFYIDNIVVE